MLGPSPPPSSVLSFPGLLLLLLLPLPDALACSWTADADALALLLAAGSAAIPLLLIINNNTSGRIISPSPVQPADAVRLAVLADVLEGQPRVAARAAGPAAVRRRRVLDAAAAEGQPDLPAVVGTGHLFFSFFFLVCFCLLFLDLFFD